MNYNKRQRLSCLWGWGLAAITVAFSGPALAANPEDVAKVISAYPALKGVKVTEAKVVENHFTISLGSRKAPAIVFNTGTDKKPVWNVAIYPKSFDFGKLYRKGGGAVLGDLALSSPALVIAPAQSAAALNQLPKPVQAGIAAVFGNRVKNVTYPAGVNFSAKVSLSKSNLLKELKPSLGVTDSTAAMAGALGADVVRYLANANAKTAKGDLAKVSLTMRLTGMKPKEASRTFTSPNVTIIYRADKQEVVRLGGYADITAVIGKDKWLFKTALSFDPAAKNADTKRISIRGAYAAKLSKPIAVGAHSAKALSLDAAVMGNGRLAVAFAGSDTAGKPFTVNAALKSGKIELQQTFAANTTVKDILGYSQQALDKVPFKNPKQVGDVVTGTVRLAGEDMAAFAFKPSAKAKHPYLALIPKAFSFATWVPRIKGTPLDAAKVDKAALMVVPSGGGGDRALKELPKLVADKLSSVVGTATIRDNKNKLPIADGVNLYTRIDVNKSNVMRVMFDALGIKEKLVTLVGSINPVVFHVLPEKAAAELKQDKKIHEEILKTVRIATKISKPQIPGAEKVLAFTPGELRFRGDAVYDRMGARTDTGDVEVVAEIINGVKIMLPGKTIAMNSQLNFHKGIADKSFEIKAIGTSSVDWQKAFGIPFLTLGDISLAATLNVDKAGKRTFVAGLGSKTQLGRQTLETSVELVIEKGRVNDFVLTVPGKVELANLPGLGNIPGIKDFVFEDFAVSKAATHGKLAWKPLGYKAAAAIVSIEGAYSLFARVEKLSLKTLLPKLPKPLDVLAELKMPRAVLAFSAKKLTGFELANLPAAAQDMLKDIIKSGANEVPIWDGVTLIGAVGEKDLPKPLHKIIADDLGVFKVIDGDLVLAGGINGIFGGNPKIGLYADLPGFKFPANQPWSRIVSFDKAKANFFIRGDVAATMLNLGVGGEMQLKVPHLDNPKKVDTLKFRGEGYVSADAVSAAGGVKIAGRMEGKWREPFGLKNFAFENPAILVGADSEGSVEFGIGASAEFAARNNQTLKFAGDFVTNINFSSTIPLPKKLGVRLKASKLSAIGQMEVADALFRGVMTGPMANLVVAALPDPASKKAAQYVQKELQKRSLLDILQIDKLPIPYIEHRDVDMFFATPGAVIPGREDTLEGMGMVVAAKTYLGLMGQKTQLSEINNRLTFKDGLKIYAKLPPRSLGPLKLRAAVIDAAANIQALPYFKIKADASLFGASEKLDIELSKDKIAFFYDKNLGPVLKMRIDARTVGQDLFRVKDFIVSASTGSKLDEILVREVMPRLGIPEVIGKAIQKANPLLITGGSFNGSLTEFVTGKPVVLKLEHKLFGEKVDPAVVELRPVWKDPLSAFPAVPIARALNKSMLFHLAAHPIKLPRVDLGLLKVDGVTLSALVTDPEAPKFRVSGKSQFLGASRAIDVALGEDAYVFNMKDKIAGGLWNADLRAWTVGGTAASPNDIRYYGTVSSDFYTWLQKQVGGTLNKGFNTVGAAYRNAQSELKKAEDKVRGINGLIERKRADARRDLDRIRNLIRTASKALDHADWLFRKARDAYEWFRDKRRGIERRGWFPFKGAVVWGAKKAEWAAEKVLDGARDVRNGAQRALNRIAEANIPLDLHPLVAPLIVARELAITTLRGAQLTLAGAEGLNNTFKDVTNKLINAVAGAKVLVVKKAVFTGSIREAKTDFHLNADILNSPDHFMRLKINLSKPWETDLRDLAVTISSIIKGEKVQAARGSLPEPPHLPIATVSKKEIQAAIYAAARAQIERRKAAERKERERQQRLVAQGGGLANVLLIGHQGRCIDVSMGTKNKRGARRIQMYECHGQQNQRFTMTSNGELRVDGLCLDPQEGSWLWGYKCTGHVGMRFRMLSDGRIQNIRSGLCVDLWGVESGNGKPLRLGGCHNGANQKWKVAANVPGDTDTFSRAQLANVRSQCADEASGKLTRGGKVILWTCNGSGAARDRQLWTHNARGQIQTTNGLCLDVESGKTKPKRLEPIIIWSCNSSGSSLARQLWRRLPDGRIQHISGGQCIDATNDGNQRGRLVLNTCSNEPTQKWSLRDASG